MAGALGEFEQLLLFAVVRLGEEAYGANIRRDVERRTGRNVAAGAVYTTLERLESRGLVASAVGTPTPERGGRRRRYYRLSPTGAVKLKRSYLDLEAMARDQLERLDTLIAEGAVHDPGAQ